RIDENTRFLVHPTDRGQTVCVRACARHKTIASLELRLQRAQIEITLSGQLSPQRLDPFRIAAHQVEHETLEVRCLRDIHGRTGGCVRLCRRTRTAHTRAEELFEDAVSVG